MRKPLFLFLLPAAFGLSACQDITFKEGDYLKKTPAANTAADTDTGADTAANAGAGAESGPGETPASLPDSLTAVSDIRLNMVKTSLSLSGETARRLTATVLPRTAANREVLWVSLNSAVATVDANGLVTARSAGTAVITAVTREGGKTSSCAVYVDTEGRHNVRDVAVTALSGQINLSWENPPDADFAGAEITWTPSGGPSQPVTLTGGETGYQISGLTNGKTYTVRLRAVYAAGAKSGEAAYIAVPEAYTLFTPLANPRAVDPFDTANPRVTLSLYAGAPPGTEIWYTINGGDPRTAGTRYTGPFAIFTSGSLPRTATLKAAARKNGYADSPVLTLVYKTIVAPDPASWTEVQTPLFERSAINGVCYGGAAGAEKFVAVGNDGSMAYSADGLDWRGIPAGTGPGESTFPTGTSIDGVCYGGAAGGAASAGKFVAVGSRGNMAYSADGENWTAVTSDPFNGSRIYGVCYGGAAGGAASAGKFVAVGNNKKIAYSADGENWTVASNPFGGDYISGVCYGGAAGAEKFVAVGRYGNMVYSADGENWRAVTSYPFGREHINGVCYGGAEDGGAASGAVSAGKFVAVGGGGKVAYSEDGINWTPVPAGTQNQFTNNFHGVCYGAGKFVAVADEGGIYSEDGINWRLFTKASVIFNCVCYGTRFARFVVAGFAVGRANEGIIECTDLQE